MLNLLSGLSCVARPCIRTARNARTVLVGKRVAEPALERLLKELQAER
jgi:hypothetical protein